MVDIQKYIRINDKIKSAEVRVIGPNSEQVGVVSIRRALDMAIEQELDLVEVSPTSKPPVCRIMNFSKYKYDQEKKERRVKRNQKITHLKQLRLKPNIDEHDYHIKMKQAIEFLERKDKVKINLFFRGRELAFKDRGRAILEKAIVDVAQYGEPEKLPALEGNVMYVVINPKSGKAPGAEAREPAEETKG